jgi:acetyl esterase
MLDQVKALLGNLSNQNLPKISEIPPEMGRQAFAAMVALLEKPAPKLPRVENKEIDSPNGTIPVRLYDPKPDSEEPTNAIVFFHGGGFVIGNIETHDSMTAAIAERTGLPVISVDYRLAPENPFPAGLDDCLHVTRWTNAAGTGWLGRPIHGVIPMGDSAGGNLAAVVAQQLHSVVPMPAQILLYPVTDMAKEHPSRANYGVGYLLEQREMEFFANSYLGSHSDLKDPRISPIYAEYLESLPKALVVVAEYDPLHDEGLAYAKAMADAGVQVKVRDEAGLIHGFYNLRGAMPVADEKLSELCADLNTLLA